MSYYDKDTRTLGSCRNGESVNSEIYDTIFQNATVRDLPKYAEMYGMYSTFFVGDKHIYFVYGYDRHMIHEEPFIEAHNWIYPECELEKYGYTQRATFIRKSWNIGILDGDTVDYSYIRNRMSTLEMLYERYKIHGIDMPEFMFFPNDYVEAFSTLINAIDNKTFEGTAERETSWLREQYLLEGIAVPEWPICPEHKKPGILAFIGISGCIPDTFDKVQEVYDHPETWRSNFEKYCETCYVYADIDPDEAAFVMRELDKHGYMYKVSDGDEMVKREQQSEREMFAEALGRCIDTKITPKKQGVTFAVYNPAIDYVMYLFDVYKYKNRITPEEAETGRRMMSDLYDAGTKEKEPAYFIFGVPDYAVPDFREFCRKMDVEYGYAEGYYMNELTTGGLYYISPLYNMPSLEFFLQEQYNRRWSEHSVSSAHDAPGEIRTRDMNGISCHIKSLPWDLMGTDYTAIDVDTGKTSSISGKELVDASWCYPLETFKRSGHFTDNDD